MYTQNIDGLEEKAGLTSANPQDFLTSGSATIPAAASSSKGKNKFQGDLVHLHGRAALVRCTVCTYTGEWTEEISQAYEAGYSMPCSQCQERLSLRKALGKRLNVAVGSLRPAITLYGEHGMEDLFISEISNADVRSRPDCLIIFGTSLKVNSDSLSRECVSVRQSLITPHLRIQVHGFKQLAKDFAREVEENDGKVIYVNLTEPGKEWNSSIHYHGTCRIISILIPMNPAYANLPLHSEWTYGYIRRISTRTMATYPTTRFPNTVQIDGIRLSSQESSSSGRIFEDSERVFTNERRNGVCEKKKG